MKIISYDYNGKIIDDLESWYEIAPPKAKGKHWKDGRSAKELARYLTNKLPDMPNEISDYLSKSDIDSNEGDIYELKAEHVTTFDESKFGKGGGRNHDAILYNSNVVIGIEAKADEPLDNIIEKWVEKGNRDNRKKRIQAFSKAVFGDSYENHLKIRYQLLSSLVGVLWEAKNRKCDKAVLLVITFKKNGLDGNNKPYFDEECMKRNDNDIARFLNEKLLCYDENSGKIQTKFGKENNIATYFKHITVAVD